MSDGDAVVDEWIRKLAALKASAQRSAEAIAEVALDHSRAAVAAQQSPNGGPWPPGKSEARVLVNAGAKIQSKASGTQAELSIGPPESYHHQGSSWRPARELIPVGLPAALAAKIARMLSDKFRLIMK